MLNIFLPTLIHHNKILDYHSNMHMPLFNIMMSNYTPLNLTLITCMIIFSIILISKVFNKPRHARKVYLVDYACFVPKKSQQVSREKTLALIKLLGPNLTEKTLKLMEKMMNTSGFGGSTCLPDSFISTPPDISLRSARLEAEAAIFASVHALLSKTGVKVEDVGVLVVNCSLFNPIPSLTSIIVNRYKLKKNVKSFNLSGMGCSASLIAIDLAHHLLKVNNDTYAMVVSTEIITPFMYQGNDPSKQAISCVFRVGGTAILLSNKPSDHNSPKYELIHTVRTNTSGSEKSYKCIHLEEDVQGFPGVTVTKGLLVVAKNGIKAHLTTVGRLVLPTSEIVLVILNYVRRRFRSSCSDQIKPYVPNFGRVIDHCIPHVGGKIVLDELEKILKLDAEPSRMALYRFGNTSSSSLWYGLAYAEAKGRIKKGDRVWQMAFGSGFKCNSVIWRAMKSVISKEEDNPWSQEIEKYPIKEDFKAYPFDFEKTN